MTTIKPFFVPTNEAEREIQVEERFRAEVQQLLHELMLDRGMTQRQLAKRLRISDARVSQIFSDKCNLTLRLLARCFHAVGEVPQLSTLGGRCVNLTNGEATPKWQHLYDGATMVEGARRHHIPTPVGSEYRFEGCDLKSA
jgi:predicted XRE-type DNA-binding protein